MSKEVQVPFAVCAWDYALGLAIHALPGSAEREALLACKEKPPLTNIRAALAMDRDRPWLPLIESALIEIGLAALEDILGKVKS